MFTRVDRKSVEEFYLGEVNRSVGIAKDIVCIINVVDKYRLAYVFV